MFGSVPGNKRKEELDMAWIESHQSLGGHLKLRRLARILRIHRAQAIGHLHLLWWWALDGAPTGDLSGLTPEEIAELAEWPGDANAFVSALKACGWIDPDGRLHDWADYTGRLIDEGRQARAASEVAARRKNTSALCAACTRS